MRILQVMGGAGAGGAEGFFSRLCIGLAEAGIDQRVAVPRNADCLGALRQGGLDPVELPFLTNFDIVTRARLARLIKNYAPSIVLTWMNRATVLCPRGRFIHVARLGGYYNLKYYAACDHLIGNTADIVEYCRRGGWGIEQTHYLPNFVDETTGDIVPRASLGAAATDPVLLALGRLHDDKAFDILLRAMAHLPGVHLWLAGEGPEKTALLALAIRLGVADRVRFLGWRKDAGALLEAADCLVCPSRVEPLGNVILEGWAHRRPVVAAASAGPAGLIENGRTGLLVPVDDVDALTAALRRVIDDTALANILGENGHAVYVATFSKQAVLGRYIDFLSMVAQPCAASPAL
jgi:glycosyltransferase involved in cell wall biosynthesis